MKLLIVLFPIIGAIDARAPVRSVETNSLGAFKTPTADVQLTCALVRKDYTGRAEDVRLDVHGTPCQLEVIDKAKVEFVRSSGVVELARAELLDHGDFVVDAKCNDQRNDNAANLPRFSTILIPYG